MNSEYKYLVSGDIISYDDEYYSLYYTHTNDISKRWIKIEKQHPNAEPMELYICTHNVGKVYDPKNMVRMRRKIKIY